MRRKENFNNNWFFHLGEIGHFPKAVKKAGTIAGLTNALDGESGDPIALSPIVKMMHQQQQSQEQQKEGEEKPTLFSVFFDKDISSDKTGWTAVDIPHDFRIEQDYKKTEDTNLITQGYLEGNIAYYRKVFKISKADEGNKIFLEFDGVMRNSSVWLNGCYLGDHVSGYIGFSYDITDLLKYGEEEGDNVLLVRTDTSKDVEGWWYEGAGIYRNVWLTKCDHLHIDIKEKVYVTTPLVSKEKAIVNIQTAVSNEYTVDKEYGLRSTIFTADGKEVASYLFGFCIEALETSIPAQQIEIETPKLWSTQQPNMYRLVSEIICENVIRDTFVTDFGVRKFEYTREGLFINGEHTVIKGVCCHQDFGGVGIALTGKIIEYKLQKLKEMGCNAYRTGAHPQSPELLDLCDRMGIIVMNDNRIMESSELKIEDLKSLIYRDRNHPCVFIWNLSNEEFIGGSFQGIRMLKRLVVITKKLDSIRPITTADMFGLFSEAYTNILDITGINYAEGPMLSGHIDDFCRKAPERLFINTENTASFSTRGIYEDMPDKGYCSSMDTQHTMFGAVMDSGTLGGAAGSTLPQNSWKFYLTHPYTGGIFVWSGFDYRGEAMPFHWPAVISNFGIMDICGFKKDYYYYFKSIWTEEPMIHIFPHWNWPDKIGEKIKLRCYTNCEQAELKVNGVSMGIKPSEENIIDWETEYTPGSIEARGFVNNILAAEVKTHTTEQAYKICIETQHNKLDADAQDIAILSISVRDKENRIIPTADNTITLTVSGEGKLHGVANGDPASHEPDKANERKCFNGRCLAIVKSTHTKGIIEIKADSPGLVSSTIKIRTGKQQSED